MDMASREPDGGELAVDGARGRRSLLGVARRLPAPFKTVLEDERSFGSRGVAKIGRAQCPLGSSFRWARVERLAQKNSQIRRRLGQGKIHGLDV